MGYHSFGVSDLRAEMAVTTDIESVIGFTAGGRARLSFSCTNPCTPAAFSHCATYETLYRRSGQTLRDSSRLIKNLTEIHSARQAVNIVLAV